MRHEIRGEECPNTSRGVRERELSDGIRNGLVLVLKDVSFRGT